MIQSKKYNVMSFVLLIMRIIPLQSLYNILHTILSSLLPAAKTLAIANFIDSAGSIFEGEKEFSSIYIPILLILACIVIENVMPALLQLVNTSGKNKLNIVIKKDITRKCARLEYKHIENKDTCELVNRVCLNPIKNFEDGFQNILKGIGLFIHTVSLFIIVMSSTFIGGIAILGISIPLFGLAFRTGHKNYEMEKRASNIKRKYDYLSDVLIDKKYAEERKLFSYSNSLSRQYEGLFNKSYRLESEIEIKKYFNMKSGSLVTILISLVIMTILLPAIAAGRMSIGVYIALVSAIFNLIQSMSWQLAGAMHEFARLKEYLKEFSVFMTLSEKEGASDIPSVDEKFSFESLEFKNVTFKYPGTENYVLKNCSFKLDNFKNYAFVGENGAGKTTITKLIIGLYDDYEGEILINGKSIREIEYARLKGMISVVFQDYARYFLTVKENIVFGNLSSVNDERVWEVLKECGLFDTVKSLNDDINTYLGKVYENSVDFSGGQWQKLAIARLLYSNSAINILDEPTASLDPIAEAKLYELFNSIKKERFTIYITHRLGAARIADEILVIGDGHIIEQGSHRKLMENEEGIYRKMYMNQRSWYVGACNAEQ
ncbi:ABC transporter ATP-binding protein [Eisenbergiella tayi]|jgi:ATP-binding cassette subfamily B protein|nr:ABC transporter ATP-binding protein [Eisenbergiella tayi]